jgi:hypothetical protein
MVFPQELLVATIGHIPFAPSFTIGERDRRVFFGGFFSAMVLRNNVIGAQSALLSHPTLAACCGMMRKG